MNRFEPDIPHNKSPTKNNAILEPLNIHSRLKETRSLPYFLPHTVTNRGPRKASSESTTTSSPMTSLTSETHSGDSSNTGPGTRKYLLMKLWSKCPRGHQSGADKHRPKISSRRPPFSSTLEKQGLRALKGHNGVSSPGARKEKSKTTDGRGLQILQGPSPWLLFCLSQRFSVAIPSTAHSPKTCRSNFRPP